MGWARGIRTSKFGAKRTELVGRSFASRGEANCFLYLQAMEQAGEIRDITCQQTVLLTDAKIRYIADFKFWDIKLDQWVWADFKGFETEVWNIKKRLWKFYGPGILRVYKGASMTLAEEIRGPGEPCR